LNVVGEEEEEEASFACLPQNSLYSAGSITAHFAVPYTTYVLGLLVRNAFNSTETKSFSYQKASAHLSLKKQRRIHYTHFELSKLYVAI